MPEEFSIPEQHVKLGQGVLRDLWDVKEPLPRLQGFSLYAYFVRRGVDNILALPLSNSITIMTIAISLFLFSGFLVVIQNVDRIISGAGGVLNVTAYVREGAQEAEVKSFMRELADSSWVRDVTYVDKENALKSFRAELGSHGGFLDGLDGRNPLPASIDIVLQPDELKIGRLTKAVERLRKNPLVDEVVYGSEWVDRMQRILKVFRLFGYAGLLVVFGVIVFLISNTIKLVIYARRDEIEIMQLVGATNSFVRVPFMIGGVLQGVAGAVIGLAFLKLCFTLVSYELKYSTLFGLALPKLVFLSPFVVIFIVLIGVFIGAIGSFFALGRFMNV